MQTRCGRVANKWFGCVVLFVLVSLSLSVTNSSQAKEGAGLPPGVDRELVADTCTACHSAAIIVQNRMSRKRWDETLTWMQEKQGLGPLTPDVRRRILDYLARHQGVETPGAPASNKMYEFHYPPNPL